MSMSPRRLGLNRGGDLLGLSHPAGYQTSWETLTSNRLTTIVALTIIGLLVAQMILSSLTFSHSRGATFTPSYTSFALTQAILTLVIASAMIIVLYTLTQFWGPSGDAPYTTLLVLVVVSVFAAAFSFSVFSNVVEGDPITNTSKNGALGVFVLTIIVVFLSAYLAWFYRTEVTQGLARLPFALGFV